MAAPIKILLRVASVLLYPFLTVLLADSLGVAVLVPLYLPALINLFMLVIFSRSLFSGRTMIEEFAVRIHSRGVKGRVTLSQERIEYCRRVTLAWCGLFLINGIFSFLLAFIGELRWWSLHTGVLSYVLMGMLFLGEYLWRRYRFEDNEGIFIEKEAA